MLRYPKNRRMLAPTLFLLSFLQVYLSSKISQTRTSQQQSSHQEIEHYVSDTFARNARHLVCNRRKALCEDDYGPSVRAAMSTVITADCKVPTDRFKKRSISHAKISENYTAREPRANYSHYVTHVRKTRHGQKARSPARLYLRAAEAKREYFM